MRIPIQTNVRFSALSVILLKIVVCRDRTSCQLVQEGFLDYFTLNTEVLLSFETMVITYQSIRRDIQLDFSLLHESNFYRIFGFGSSWC